MAEEDIKKERPSPEKPPFFSTWRGMYAFVLVWEAVLILLFYLFTLYYNG